MAQRKPEDTAYLNSLEYGRIDSISHAKFSQSYKLFADMFTWDGEPILDPTGYERLFAFNDNKEFQSAYGPQQLMMTYAHDAQSGGVVGGTDYTAMLVPEELAKETGVDVVYFGAHIYIDPSKRQVGLALRLVEEREKEVRAYAANLLGKPAETIRLLAVNEQNDPRKMTLEDVQEDIDSTGVHPCNRIISSSERAGWRVIDDRFNYREIDRDGDAGIDFMALNVKGPGREPPPASFSPEIMVHFLKCHAATRRYGADPALDPKFNAQVAELRALGTLVPTDISPEVRALKPVIDAGLAALKAPAENQAASPAPVAAPAPKYHRPLHGFNSYGKGIGRYSPARPPGFSSSLKHS